MSDWYNFLDNYGTGLGGTDTPAGWGPQTAPDTSANTTDGSGAIPATAQPTQGSGLAGLFSMFGGGGDAGAAAVPSAPAPVGTTVKPGYQQSMIGLGLGLLSMPKYQFYGQPSRWAPVMQGYQAGAAADLARAKEANTAQYQQQELALRRQALFAPQVHFGQYEDENGYIKPYAAMYDRAGNVRPIDMKLADQMSSQPGAGVTVTTPWGERVTVPPGTNVKDLRKKMSDIQSDILTGKTTPDQARAKEFADQMKTANDALLKENLDHQGLSTLGGVVGGVARTLGPAGEVLASKYGPGAYNNFNSQKNGFLSAIMRRDRIPEAQRGDLDKFYFPQPGEGPAEVAAKRAAREQAIANTLQGAGPAYRRPPGARPQPTANDRAWIRAHPEDRQRFINRFGVEP